MLSSRGAAPSSPPTPRAEEVAGGGGGAALATEDDDESKPRNHGPLGARLSRMLCFRIAQSRRSCFLPVALLLVLIVALFIIRRHFGPRECESRDGSFSRIAMFSGSIGGLASDFGILGVPWSTEWVKGKQMEEVVSIKNTEIAKHLSLPPVKLHCSMLAEDAIKAAVKDYEKKKSKLGQNKESVLEAGEEITNA